MRPVRSGSRRGARRGRRGLSSGRALALDSPVVLHRGGVFSFEHDVEAVAECPLRLRRFEVEGGDHTLAGLLIAHRLEDGGLPEERQMYVRRTPGVVMVVPRIGPGLYRHEAVAALTVREAAASPREVGIERSRVPIFLVGVASGGVGLPDLDEAVPDRASVAVEDTPGNDDPLAKRLAGMLAGQIAVKLPYETMTVRGTRDVRERPGEDNERLLRRPEPRRHVIRVEVGGLDAVVAPVPSGLFSRPLCHATFPLLRSLHLPQLYSWSALSSWS